MTKRLVDIDDGLLEAARAATGETTIRATVTMALERVAADGRQREDALQARWASLGEELDDLQDPDVMASAWS